MIDTTPWYKKIFTPDFILFALFTLGAWTFIAIHIGNGPGVHSPYDTHTRQAIQWQQGRIDIDDIQYLELAVYDNKFYISFPPTPTFIEFPFTLIYGINTPNCYTLLLFTWLGMLFSFFILLKLTENRLLSYIIAFFFYWGSNIFYLSLEGSVWHQGQLYGVFMTQTAFLLLLYGKGRGNLFASGFFLALAVGCRPFYLFMAPFFYYQGAKKEDFKKVLFWFTLGMIPMGLFYATYNFIRFDNPLEFGHAHLPGEKASAHGVFSIHYMKKNFTQAFATLPRWEGNYFSFSGSGTAIWAVSPFILSGLFFFFKKGIPWQEKVTGGFSLLAIFIPLLMHVSGGAHQFGFRYTVDIIPLLIFFAGLSYRYYPPALIPLGCYSTAVNVYGALIFYSQR